MVKKRAFLLRIDPRIYELLQAWAADELRSLNGQIEFLLVRALRASARMPGSAGEEIPLEARSVEHPED